MAGEFAAVEGIEGIDQVGKVGGWVHNREAVSAVEHFGYLLKLQVFLDARKFVLTQHR